MATYSGLFNTVFTDGVSTGVGTPLVFNDSEKGKNTPQQISRELRDRVGKKLGAIIKALNGAAPGGAILVQRNQVPAAAPFTYSNFGLIPKQLVTDINRVSTAADETAIDAMIDLLSYPSPYPADRSGNGGGGKSKGYGA